MGEHMDAAMRRRLDLALNCTGALVAAALVYGAIRYDGNTKVHMVTSLVCMFACMPAVLATARAITLATTYGLRARSISIGAAIAWAVLALIFGAWGNAFTGLMAIFTGPVVFLMGTKYVFGGYVCEEGSKPWRQTGWSDGRPLEGA